MSMGHRMAGRRRLRDSAHQFPRLPDLSPGDYGGYYRRAYYGYRGYYPYRRACYGYNRPYIRAAYRRYW
jgi:hypothetical protein